MTTTSSPIGSAARRLPAPAPRGRVSQFAARYPVAITVTLLVGLTWVSHIGALLMGVPVEAALLFELALFIVVPPVVAGIIGGRAEVKRLLAGLLRWRIGVTQFFLVLVALPALTVGVALITGTFHSPAEGWPAEIGAYLLQSILLLGVIGNIPEEAAWGGFVQGRLMDRHGFVAGSLLTAIPFALIHLPFAFDAHGLSGTSWTDVAVAWTVLIGVAPVMRLLMGSVLLGTGGSVLAIGLLHASFNGAGRLTVVDGGWWQNLVALVVLAAVLVGVRLVRSRSAHTRATLTAQS